AEVGLPALADHLLEARPRAVAIHDVIERLDRRLVDGTAREEIAVAGLGIEQAYELAELGISCRLRYGRSVALDIGTHDSRGAHLVRDVGDAPERALRHLQAEIDMGDGLAERLEGGGLRVQADREAAIEPETFVGVGLLAGGEL